MLILLDLLEIELVLIDVTKFTLGFLGPGLDPVVVDGSVGFMFIPVKRFSIGSSPMLSESESSAYS